MNLQTAKYTSDGDKNGQPLDLKNIRIVCFWGNGNQAIAVSDMYLTNNDDYTREDTSDISFAQADGQHNSGVWSLSSQLIRSGSDSQKSLQDLPSGVYIVGNKKIIIR
jgi:hypothetical protein